MDPSDTFTITHNANATAAMIEAPIENLAYFDTTATPTANRTLVMNVTDAAGDDLGSFGQATFTPLTGANDPFIEIVVGERSMPCFVDLDGDGDLDLVLGEYNGSLKVWSNTNGVFSALTAVANPIDGVDSICGAPQLCRSGWRRRS